MNRERAKELLPVIQAFAEGKTIQWRKKNTYDAWRNCGDDEVFSGPYDFRIKPEPLECWMVRQNDGAISVFSDEDDARDAVNTATTHIMKMREVTE